MTSFHATPLRARGKDPVTDSIDRGVDYLLPVTTEHLRDLKKGNPREVPPTDDTGLFVFQMYSLVVAGVSLDHPTIKEGLRLLSRLNFRGAKSTYVTSGYVFLLDAAIAQLEDDLLMTNPQRLRKELRDNPKIGRAHRQRLRAAVDALIDSQNAEGAWHYKYGAASFDNSNTQFAVLALGIGAKRGVKVGRDVWRKVMDHFLEGQEGDGPLTKKRITLAATDEDRRDRVRISSTGGGTRNKPRSTARKRTRKGTTGVKPTPENPVVGTEALEVRSRGWGYRSGRKSGGQQGGGRRRGGGRPAKPSQEKAKWSMTCAGQSSMLLVRDNIADMLSVKERNALNKSIRDGYGWLMEHWKPTGAGYDMYSLEKVGDIGHVEKIGDNDWYAQLEKHLLEKQRPDGSWGGRREKLEGLPSAYALLILNRATMLLSRSPVSRIIVTGRAAPAGDVGDRSWVYVPKLDTTLHYPSLLRAVRLRPTPNLIKFLSTVVDNYPEEWRGEMVPDLVAVRRAGIGRSAQRAIDGYLFDIVGTRYSGPELYEEWHQRWQEVVDMGTSGKSSHIPTLLNYYRATVKSVPLRKTIMWALTRLKAREALPIFIADLKHRDGSIRLAAYGSFKAFFVDFPPPFDPTAQPAVRERQVEAIIDWFAEQ